MRARWVGMALAALLTVVLWAGSGRGQLPAAGAASGADHAWFIVDQPGEMTRVIAHAPPRSGLSGAAPAPEGRLARAAGLDEPAEFMVASGARAVVVMPANAEGFRRVLEVRAEALGLRDLWGYRPTGRLGVLPGLEDAGSLLSVALTAEAMHALVQRGPRPTLLTLADGTWSAGPDLPGGEGVWTLWADELGLVLVQSQWPSVRLFRPVEGGWGEPLVLEGAWPTQGRLVGVWRGEPIVLRGLAQGGTSVVALSPGGERTLGSTAAPAHASVAIVGSVGRLLSLWTVPRPASLPGESATIQQLSEFSLVSGRELYAEAISTAAPVSPGEFRMLALLLVGLTVLVLVAVLRPGQSGPEPVLPPMTALAPPGRRLLATLLDLLPAVLLTGRVMGLSTVEVLGPAALPLTGSIDVLPPLVALTLAATHSAVGEMVFGRSLGKAMTGLFVARVDPLPGVRPEPGRFRAPTPGGAILRNVVKWFLPPVAMLALGETSGRHRGDVLAKSAVLVAVPDVR